MTLLLNESFCFAFKKKKMKEQGDPFYIKVKELNKM